MLGREADYLRLLERAHHAHLADGRALRALRCAFWIGVTLARKGELGQAGGWLGRAQRLLDPADGEHVERGYLLLPAAFEQEAGGELGAAARHARARRPRSASASATPTSSRSPGTSRATCSC